MLLSALDEDGSGKPIDPYELEVFDLTKAVNDIKAKLLPVDAHLLHQDEVQREEDINSTAEYMLQSLSELISRREIYQEDLIRAWEIVNELEERISHNCVAWPAKKAVELSEIEREVSLEELTSQHVIWFLVDQELPLITFTVQETEDAIAQHKVHTMSSGKLISLIESSLGGEEQTAEERLLGRLILEEMKIRIDFGQTKPRQTETFFEN